ncbi:unnamed protein product [Mytilus edulis]|uniref:Peptidase A2 domain-containing protein n=1 Tax=Mytilus edulis TaxID=6550 RepID=A0A8S3PXP3_MYTED|nr:unnamed protein product [Mytilus edulis]
MICAEVAFQTPLQQNTIDVIIDKRKTHGLIDTGASISIINKELLDKTGYAQDRLKPPTYLKIKGVSGQKLNVLGKIEIDIMIDGKIFKYPLNVVENVHHSLILGFDFINHFNGKIDCGNKTLHLIDGKEALVSQIKEIFGLARTTEAITIPKSASPVSLPFYRTSHKQQTEINKQVDEMEKNGIIEPSNSVWHSPVILVAKKNTSELSQKDCEGNEHPIAYGGRSLKSCERNWTTTEKECLAIICGVQAYHPYLSSARFTVQTDHKALCWLNNVKNPSARIGRWALALQPYKFDVIYKEGKTNSVADALSRREYNNTNEKDSSLTDSGQMEEDIFFISENQQLSNEKKTEGPRSQEVDIQTSDNHNTKISSVSDIENCSKQLPGYSDERIYVEFIYPDDPVAFVAPVTEEDIDEAVNDQEHLLQMQKDCPDFKPILEYLLTDDLPDEDKMARKAVLNLSATKY